jgi:hypothetical protein
MTTNHRPDYRIGVRASGLAELEQYQGEALGYLPRALLAPEFWQAIAPTLELEIRNRRERATGRRGRWGAPIALDRYEGKEALLLFWGLERATLDQVPAVLANWRGLAPEERWWLVTQAEATRGTPAYHPERGWRAAIVHILTENSVCP